MKVTQAPILTCLSPRSDHVVADHGVSIDVPASNPSQTWECRIILASYFQESKGIGRVDASDSLAVISSALTRDAVFCSS